MFSVQNLVFSIKVGFIFLLFRRAQKSVKFVCLREEMSESQYLVSHLSLNFDIWKMIFLQNLRKKSLIKSLTCCNFFNSKPDKSKKFLFNDCFIRKVFNSESDLKNIISKSDLKKCKSVTDFWRESYFNADFFNKTLHQNYAFRKSTKN